MSHPNGRILPSSEVRSCHRCIRSAFHCSPMRERWKTNPGGLRRKTKHDDLQRRCGKCDGILSESQLLELEKPGRRLFSSIHSPSGNLKSWKDHLFFMTTGCFLPNTLAMVRPCLSLTFSCRERSIVGSEYKSGDDPECNLILASPLDSLTPDTTNNIESSQTSHCHEQASGYKRTCTFSRLQQVYGAVSLIVLLAVILPCSVTADESVFCSKGYLWNFTNSSVCSCFFNSSCLTNVSICVAVQTLV